MSRPLLILRPEPGATKTLERARSLGIEAHVYPLFYVIPLSWTGPDPGGCDAILFTSTNALRHGGPGLVPYHILPAYAVGEATSAAALEAGFVDVVTGAGTVEDAVGDAAARGHIRLFHPGGRHRTKFSPPNPAIVDAAVYEAAEAGDATGLADAVAPGMALLVHSPRAGRRLAQLLPSERRSGLFLVGISTAAVDAAGTGWAAVHVADRPDDNALLALAAGLCE
jgi:uroporphyrinogen-III synthase